jgi:hypothetical protein
LLDPAQPPSWRTAPRLLIQYIRSYPSYLDAVSSIRNQRTRRAVVARDPLNMDECCYSSTNCTDIPRLCSELWHKSKERLIHFVVKNYLVRILVSTYGLYCITAQNYNPHFNSQKTFTFLYTSDFLLKKGFRLR